MGQGPSGRSTVDTWSERYATADDPERRIVEAALRCIARWGLAKTSFDDIAREAGVSRATVYRLVPGGKDRLVELVTQHELGRVAHEVEEAASGATGLEDLLCIGLTTGLRLVTGHEALRYLVVHEPEVVLPHFAFRRLDRVFDMVEHVTAPHLARFLPPDAIRPAAELLVRVVLTYSFYPSVPIRPGSPGGIDPPAIHADRPESIRRLVQVYLLPAVTSISQGDPR